MFKPPPLTREDLLAIQQRDRTEDMRAVLWDLFRLRALVLRMHYAFNAMDQSGELRSRNRFTRETLRDLRADVNEEPIVHEAQEKMRQQREGIKSHSPDLSQLWGGTGKGGR